MSAIDPIEFGRLQSQVETLIESNRINTATLETMSEALHAMQLQMAEAKGGWKTLVFLGGAAASLGGAISWVLSHVTMKGPS